MSPSNTLSLRSSGTPGPVSVRDATTVDVALDVVTREAAPAGDAGRRDTGVDSSRVVGRDAGRGLDARVGDAGTTDVKALADAGASDAPAATDASVDASVACGTRMGMRGLTQRSLVAAGLQRTYLIYLPASLDATTPIPFVFVFHGSSMSGQEMYNVTQYYEVADREGIGLAFPDGEEGPGSLFPWDVENPGQTVCGVGQFVNASGNDLAFVDAMKADVLLDQCLDAPHIFATGFSMGGYFAHHIACQRSDFRAAAPHSGGTIADLSSCTTGHVPMIIFHGDSDSTIADGCDDPNATPVAGFPASATLWAARNGCHTTYATIPTDGDGGGLGQCYMYDGCPTDGQVELCTFTGMNHCWAGGGVDGGGGHGCPAYASAVTLQWNFFKQYAW